MVKVFVLGLATGVALFLTINGVASRTPQKNTEQEKYQSELADATPVRAGGLTEKQRVHGKHFNFYREMRSDGGLTSLATKAKNEGHMIVQTVVTVGLKGRPRQEEAAKEPKTFFEELTRTSDVVIRGRVTKKASQVTENDGFLFTDYDVAVLEVLKDNAAAPLTPNATITVTRQGGKVLLDGVIIIAIDKNVLPLPMNDHEVVLFLKYLSQTGAYRAMEYCVAYELEETSVKPLTQAKLPAGVIQDKDAFLETIRSVSTKVPIQKKSGA
jgi:hypothetical protein